MKIRIPSKTFLWGEYSALVGGSAGVLTSAPYFFFSAVDPKESSAEQSSQASTDTLQIKNKSESSLSSLFHPESPAGRELKNYKDAPRSDLSFKFEDPHNLQGGFGRSTAEWISAYVYKNNLSHEDFLTKGFMASAWLDYQSQFQDHDNKPSGYDLMAQLTNTLVLKSSNAKNDELQNRVCLIASQDSEPEFLNCSELNLKLNILIYKTQIKVKTHEHLESLDFKNLDSLKELSLAVTKSFMNKNTDEFLLNLKNFDTQLAKLNYKSKDSLMMTQALQSLDSVRYARGCGALGADVLVVFYEGQNSLILQEKIQQEFDLIFIADIPGID